MKQEEQRENKCEKWVKRHVERMKKSCMCLFRVQRGSWRNGVKILESGITEKFSDYGNTWDFRSKKLK